MVVINLSDRRQPVAYTVRITHHWDDRIEVFVEDVADDERSRQSVADALARAANTFGNLTAPMPEDIDRLTREREEHRAEVKKLREALRWYADPRNHFPVERRSPGDPDPAVIFMEEPPIMSDGGRRARNALEGKP